MRTCSFEPTIRDSCSLSTSHRSSSGTVSPCTTRLRAAGPVTAGRSDPSCARTGPP
ncbi:hypothetical protein STIAU_1136, partial [Stigmatella aurantiaca DW4/3-1]